MSSYDQKKVANIIAVVGVFVFTFILSLKQIYNNDLWWHLKSGVWILEHGAIPYTDTFSFLTEGEPWYNLSWLSGVVLYSVYAFSGLDGLVIFKAVLIGAGFAIACQYLIRNNVNPFLAALIVGFAAVVAAFRFLLRPSFLLFFFVPILFWLCAKLKDHFQAISITLIFMTIVWINLHGGAFLAPVFVGFVVVEQFLNQYAFKRNNLDDAPQIKFFCFVLVLLSLSLFVTPFGVKPILATLERTLLSDLVFRSYSVQEHLPLQWGSHFNYWLLMIVTGLSCLINLRRIRLYYLLVFLAVSWLSLNSMRYVGFSALLHATVLGLNARDIQRYYLPGLKRLPIKIEYTLFLPGLILLSIFGFKSIFHANAIAKWGFGLNESKYPIEAVSFLKEVNYSGNLLNGWGEGGYILWFLPKANVSLDSRALDGQLDILEKWSRSTLGEFNQFLEDKEVSAALIQKKEALLTDYLNRSEKYRLAYFDDHYLVYLRNDVFDRAGIKASGTYKYIRPTQYDVSYLKNLAAESLARAVESEFQAAMQISGNNFMLLFHYAFYLELLDRDEAVNYYLKAAKLNPALAFSHASIDLRAGRLAIKKKKYNKAIEILELASNYDRDSAENHFLLATAYYKTKQFTEAEEMYLKAIETDPENFSNYINLGYLYLDIDKFSNAERRFNQAIDLKPSESALYGYALALSGQNRPEAQKAWDDFLSRFPKSRWAEKVRSQLRQINERTQ